MLQVAGLNALDLLLLFILFLGLLVGFLRGAGPQIISVASIWLGILVTLWLYRLFSDNILQGLDLPEIASDTLAFIILFLVFFNLIRLVVKALTTTPDSQIKKPKRPRGAVGPVEEKPPSPTQRFVIGPLSAFGGMAMGVLLTAIWLAIMLGLSQFFFQDRVFEVAGGAAPGFVGQLRSSALLIYFNYLLSYLVRSVSLFVIDDSANLLEVVVNKIFEAGGGG